MKLSLTLFLAIALTMSPFVEHGPACASGFSWVWNWDQKLDVPEEQHPVESKSQTSNQPCWFGLTSCPIRIEGRKTNRVLPEEQHPVETKDLTSSWLCWLGLTSCPIRIEGRKNNRVLPEEQHPVETKDLTSSWLCWLGLTSCPVRVENGKNNQVFPKEQHTVETKILTSYWPCWLGLTSCPIRIEGRKTNRILPEGQHPVETKDLTSSWLCWLGLTSCPIRIEGRKNNRVLPEEQHPVETKDLTSSWLCWLGLTSCPVRVENGKNNQVFPKEQHTVETKILTSYWPCWLGPSQCPKWFWYRDSKIAFPEGPKQKSPGTKQKAYSLPGFLGQLWNYLVLGGRTWLLDSLITICILCPLGIACSLWRRLERPWGQGVGKAASVSMQTECQEKDDETLSNLLSLIEDQTRFEVSDLPTLHLLPKTLPIPNEDRIKHLLGQNAWTSQKNELACFYPRLASKSETGKIGLINLGNTCYMNSVIQSLHMALDFRHSVLNVTEGISQPLMTKLQSLFAHLQYSERPAISPESFLSASQAPWFTPGAQQDCSEYLKYLLNRLHEEEQIGKIYHQNVKESSLTSQATEHHSLNKTLIEKMFGGKMMTKIRCLNCLNVSCREEAFTDLSLAFPPLDRPIRGPGSISVLPVAEVSPQFIEPHKYPSQPTGSKDSRSISDLLNYFLSPERLTAENRYHCEQCASLQDAEKVAELTEGPHYLILTLLRFSFDPQTMKRTKILENISIPAVLELPILVSSEETEAVCRHGEDRADRGSTFVPAVYDLCSVVVHSGISSESGHYYCYSRECTDTVPHAPPRDGTPKLASGKQMDFEIPWYLFNDTRVSFSSFESVSNVTSLYSKDTAYVLFYRQREGRPSSPLHEAVAEASHLHSDLSLK